MENTLGPLLVLTALLGNGVLPVMADGRSVAVYQFGTTLDPHFRRVEGVIITPCPRKNPTAFDNGQKCCSLKTKINDTGLHSECDGTPLSLDTDSLCCSLANSVPCPIGQCKDAPEDGTWASWSSWSTCDCNLDNLRSTKRARECLPPKYQGSKAICPHEGEGREDKACCERDKGFWSITASSGAGSDYVKDYIISADADELWMPATNGPDEWIQVDLLYLETVIQVQIIDRQTPDYDRIRSIEVRIGTEEVSGGPQRLDQLNELCAQIPDEQTSTTVYDLPCTPGPIDGKYLTIQRDSAYGIWAVNEVDIITPFSSPDVDQVPESGSGTPVKGDWTAYGTIWLNPFAPEQAIDDDLSADMNFYHTATEHVTTPPTVGWAWLQLDFKFKWNIQSLDLQTRDSKSNLEQWDRISNIEFRIGNYFNRPGFRPITTNTLCATIGAPTHITQRTIVCSPGPIEGRFLTIQRIVPGNWEITEVDINVL